MSIGLRFRKVAGAAFFGWLVAFAAVMPFKAYDAVRTINFAPAIGAVRFAELLGLYLGLWVVMTFAIACYGCCVFLFPAVWILSPDTVVAHRRLWAGMNVIYGFVLIALRSHIWTAFGHDGVGYENFWIWQGFACTFFGITAEFYRRDVRSTVA
jgi:hypothetical protein